MSTIREEYVLADQFSAGFTRLLGFLGQASAASTAAADSQSGFADAAARSGTILDEMASSSLRTADAVETIRDAVERMASAASEAADEQEDINHKFEEGAKSADGLAGKLKGLITTYLSFRGVKSALDWVNGNLELANTQRNAENQLKAVLSNMGAQEITVPVMADVQVDTAQAMSAFDAITAKASEIQGRGIYGDEAMIAGAGELATYFKDANAIMSMMDTLADYTMGMTGGGAVDKDAMVEYATGLGKIMSGSYDAMTKKGFEFSDVQKAIIEGTATEAQIVAELGAEYLDMSADMQAAAAINSVIAESWGGLYETMSDTPEGKIIQLKNRLGDLGETLGDRIYPAVLRVVDVFNDNYPKIEQILTKFSDLCAVIINVLGWMAEAGINAFSVITEHGDLVIAILTGIGAAALAAGSHMAAAAIHSAIAWAGANWPLLLIAGLVAQIIVLAIQMGATWEDICGFVGGLLYELYAVIYNLVADAWNLFAVFAEFLVNIFIDSGTAIANLFAGLADWVLGILQSIASAIDLVFGSSLSSAVSGWRSDLKSWVSDTFGENQIVIPRMEKIGYDDAWDRGNELGREFYGTLTQLGELGQNSFDPSEFMASSGISGQLEDISADTSAIKRSVSLSEEDMKLLVDMAERQYVNNINLTAQTPVITINGQNTGDTEADLQWLEESLRKILVEQAASHTSMSYR